MEQKKKSSTALIMFVLLMMSKAGKIMAVLKTLKFAKYAITLISMAISAILYGFAYGSWWFAIGVILLLFVHEYGHVLATVKQGVKASMPIFIPFLGALIFMKETPDRKQEAYIGFGGPFIGSLGAVACIGIAFLVDDVKTATVFHLLGYVGLFLNLFNLIPARPLDGGRVLHVLGDGVVYVGLPILLLLAYVISDLMLVAIALISILESNVIKKRWITYLLLSLTCATGLYKEILDPFESRWGHHAAVFAYICITSLFLYLSYTYFKDRSEEKEDAGDQQPEELPPISVRIRWLVTYLVSVIALGSLMAWHSQYLPKEVREHSVTKYLSS